MGIEVIRDEMGDLRSCGRTRIGCRWVSVHQGPLTRHNVCFFRIFRQIPFLSGRQKGGWSPIVNRVTFKWIDIGWTGAAPFVRTLWSAGEHRGRWRVEDGGGFLSGQKAQFAQRSDCMSERGHHFYGSPLWSIEQTRRGGGTGIAVPGGVSSAFR